MCDCIDKVTEKVSKHVRETHPDWDVRMVQLTNQVISFDKGIWLLVNPLEVEYNIPKKSGGFTRKVYKVSINGTFCPFCGKEIEELKTKDKTA